MMTGMRTRLVIDGPWTSRWVHAPAEVACEPVLTMPKNSNGKVFHIRYRCQAQTSYRASRRFFNYDWLARGTAEECMAAYQQHLQERSCAT